ncbi:MAG: hypothetical protein AB7Q37_04995 [Pyrinomonadaceae bacterium]
MTTFKQALIAGTAFVALYFVFVVVTFRAIFYFGYDPGSYAYLQWPITFPIAIPPVEFWDFLQSLGFAGKSLLVTAAYLIIDILVYSSIAFVILRFRRRKGT